MPSSACPIPIVGFNLNTADAWAAGDGNLSGTWPTVWYHDLGRPALEDVRRGLHQEDGKPPENHAWIEYVSLKMMAQAMNETKSTDTDKLIAYFEKETQFDILKARKAYFRSWDHQLMQEAYPFTVKARGRPRTNGTSSTLGAAIPGANEPLECMAPTKEQNPCSMYDPTAHACAAGRAARWPRQPRPRFRDRACGSACSCWNRW